MNRWKPHILGALVALFVWVGHADTGFALTDDLGDSAPFENVLVLEVQDQTLSGGQEFAPPKYPKSRTILTDVPNVSWYTRQSVSPSRLPSS